MLTRSNINMYRKIIDVYENHKFYVTGENITIDGKPADKYVIENNYYFVLNDNRYNQPDSRTWGFIPENLIVGKVMN
jgi:signal peptidase I